MKELRLAAKNRYKITTNIYKAIELNLKGDKPILSAKVFDAVLYKTRAIEDVT